MPDGPEGPEGPGGPGAEARMWRQFERIEHALLVRDEAMVMTELETLEQLQWEIEQEFLGGSRVLASGKAGGRRRTPPLRLVDVLRVLETYHPGLAEAVERRPKGGADRPARKPRTKPDGAEREARTQPGKTKEKAGKANSKVRGADRWQEFAGGHREGQIVYGRVSKLVPFGAFVEVAKGVEGLVHISEMAAHHVDLPEQVITAGEDVWVKIIGLDSDRHRVSLSIKQTADGGEVAEEYREYLDRHNYDDQGTFVGPREEAGTAGEADVAAPAPAEESPAPAADA